MGDISRGKADMFYDGQGLSKEIGKIEFTRDKTNIKL